MIEPLFAALAANRVDTFLDGCSEHLSVTVWGSSPLSTFLSPQQLEGWWEGFQHLAGGTLVTEVLLAMADESSHLVFLRHRFTRAGRSRAYDTINVCTLRDGKLIAWFSRPLDRREYVDAWGLREPDQPDGRRAVGSGVANPTFSDDLERR